MSWIKDFYIIDGNGEKISKNYHGNNISIGNLDIDYELLESIEKEANSIMGLVGWDINQLNKYRDKINYDLSQCDLAISDITHALECYIFETGRRPAAHKLTVVGCKLLKLLEQRRKIKKCKAYVDIMIAGINHKYTLSKLRNHIQSVDSSEYKGKTEIYNEMLNVLYK